MLAREVALVRLPAGGPWGTKSAHQAALNLGAGREMREQSAQPLQRAFKVSITGHQSHCAPTKSAESLATNGSFGKLKFSQMCTGSMGLSSDSQSLVREQAAQGPYLELVRNRFLGPSSDPLNQKLWEWALESVF